MCMFGHIHYIDGFRKAKLIQSNKKKNHILNNTTNETFGFDFYAIYIRVRIYIYISCIDFYAIYIRVHIYIYISYIYCQQLPRLHLIG